MRRTIIRLRRLALFVTLVAMPAVARAQVVPTSDVAVKAAFLYNFAKFTEWHSVVSAAPITMCVVGDSRIADALVETVRDQRIDSHPVQVKGIASDGVVRDCEVLFVSTSELRRAATVLDTLRTLPMLTVSDGTGFARSGGIIEFFVEAGRMRFAINTSAADRAGLHLSSRLLGLAKIVRD